ncbi:DUF4395 domain-containing protein [Microbacterium sp. SSW1-59]|uniref:DUF4395 domain-containing protein n=1 Tax=Microbacterium xanthum TaxID=3079794 RepID=UPI002AD2FAEA|nr:DUF4395 domain-containing protein [Microbacterium sp. SSW1-59]MDZ8201799.1 DUF4395 domain-containing protein [Microbacterium sp. SSW1-59]
MSDRPRGVDPRGPRFAAGITSLLLLVDVFLGLTGLSTSRASEAASGWAVTSASLGQRAADPAFLLLAALALLFLWGVIAPGSAPWGVLYRRLIAPRLPRPNELEDPRPPRFAQGVGLFVSAIGLLLHLAGVPWALPVAAAAAFAAAFLNAAFGVCLGCQLYLVLQRAGLIGRERPVL